MSSKVKNTKPFLRRLSSLFEISSRTSGSRHASSQLVDSVRNKFLKRYQDNPDDYDECDINRIKSDDWSVQRFIMYFSNNEDKALEQLDTAMKWRKSFGINTRSENDCPKEFFQAGIFFPYNTDKWGNIMLYVRVKLDRNVPELFQIKKYYIAGVIDKIDSDPKQTGYALVLDLTGTGLRHVNMEQTHFIITLFKDYFPMGIRYVLVYNQPWILKGVWPMFKLVLGEYQKLVKFAQGEEIKEYVDEANLPKFLGGTCSQSFTEAPELCPSVYDVGPKYGFTPQEISKYMKLYDEVLQESKN